ncbi:hypothetical protein AX17_006165 [Amanita inopinata Kibby_2008]|nr:hypothetical protein AX17_006165 [Amanita inopinata Kibby_2008]
MSIEQPKKVLHSKRSIGKWPRNFDSPAYDASEEDNDPMTDDGASAVSVPVSRPNAANNSRGLLRAASSTSRARHQLAASLLSDSDGVDSPTYDGDIESSTTAGADGQSPKLHLHHRTSSTSTLNTPVTPAYSLLPDVTPSREIPEPLLQTRALDPESQHPVFISQPAQPSMELPLTPSSGSPNPASFTEEDIRTFVRNAIEGEPSRPYKINLPPTGRPVRIYADGVYDLFHFGHALQLRQAKLSFPSVHLLVGVCSDELVREHKSRCVMSHTERLEAARHCRWVDEVIPDAPWVISDDFLGKHQIDYVAHDEDPYAGAGQLDVYSRIKDQGKFLPTRRTPGISTSDLLERIVSGYRNRDFDEKLTKMGRTELRAEGSDFDDRSPTSSSRNASRLASRSESPVQNPTS